MKLPTMREFTNVGLLSLVTVSDYLSKQMNLNLKDITTAFQNLSFLDNFNSFSAEVEIPSGMEVQIPNKLRGGGIPSGRIILRSNTANIIDGEREWTNEFVSLKNLSDSKAKVTVLFLK